MFSFPIISRAKISEDFFLEAIGTFQEAQDTGKIAFSFLHLYPSLAKLTPYGSPSGIQQFSCWTLRALGVNDVDFTAVSRGGLRGSPQRSGCGMCCLFLLLPPLPFPHLGCCPARFGLMAPGLSTETLRLLFGRTGSSVRSDFKGKLSVSSCPGFGWFCDSS